MFSLNMIISRSFSPVMDDIVSRLAKGMKVERIYLFGSQASVNASPLDCRKAERLLGWKAVYN
jgi:hypothetical protein